jgi:hypothetical protein
MRCVAASRRRKRESTYLLRGKSREALAAEVIALAKRLGLEVKLAD